MSLTTSRQKDVYAALFIFLAVFIAHFLLLNGFGLYEDDYAQARYINADHGFFDALKYIYIDEARPVGRVIRYGLTWLGAEIGGLVFVYVIGYLIISLNSVLTFLIIRHLTSNHLVSVVGALIFCLYPADTTKILLTHSLQLHSGLMFTLWGLFLYQRGNRVIPYILAILSLLSYEPTMLPVLAAPFLKKELNKTIVKETLRHILILGCLVGITLFVRSLLGETRVSTLEGLDPLSLITRIGGAMAMGPLVSLTMFFYRPVTMFIESGISTYIVIIAFFCAVFLCLKYFSKSGVVSQVRRQLSFQGAVLPFNIKLDFSEELGAACKLVLVGTVLWSVSYLFAFSNDHWPPEDIQGRMTSVHMAATFAASLCLSGVIWWIYIFLESRNKNTMVFTGIVSVYFSLLAGFAYVVQQDYVRAWDYQKEFWQPIISLTPDADDDTVIFYGLQNLNLKQTKYILTHSWADGAVPDGLYGEGEPWYRFRMYYFKPALAKTFKIKEDKLYFTRPTISGEKIETQINPEDMILLYTGEDGKLKRFAGQANINNINVNIDKPSAPTPGSKRGLYYLLMQE